MEQHQLDRINALARKQKSGVGLTEDEKAEQNALRQAYIREFRASFRSQLEHTTIRYPDGREVKLSDKTSTGGDR